MMGDRWETGLTGEQADISRHASLITHHGSDRGMVFNG